MNSFLLFLMISLISVPFTLQTTIKADLKSNANSNDGNVKALDYRNSVEEIVKDLMEVWTSPLVYLRDRGYLRTPNVGFMLMSNGINDSKDDKKNGERATRRSDKEDNTPNDLKYLFRSLFSTSNDINVSDKIKSKTWDMNVLKSTVRNEASKFYEKFYDRYNGQTAKTDKKVETDTDREVAQISTSLVASEKAKRKEIEKEKTSTSSVKVAHKQPQSQLQLSDGIAQILTAWAKPLQQQSKQLKEQKETNPST